MCFSIKYTIIQYETIITYSGQPNLKHHFCGKTYQSV